MPEVGILIPAYEAGRTVAGVVSACREIAGASSIIVIDDGSTDDTLAKARDAGARLESAGKVGAGSLEKEACRLAVERRGDLLLLQNEVVVDDALPGDHALGSGLPRSDGLRPDPLARQLVEPLALHGAGEANPVGTRGRG